MGFLIDLVNRGSDKRTYIGVYKIVGYKIVEPKIGASI
jgi:hypothetical protein